MQVDNELIKKVASVARLKLTGNEITRFTPQVKEILDYFEKLNEIDTNSVKASFQPVEIRNRMREDSVNIPLTQQLALKNSTQNKDGYFKGPKAV